MKKKLVQEDIHQESVTDGEEVHVIETLSASIDIPLVKKVLKKQERDLFPASRQTLKIRVRKYPMRSIFYTRK